MESIRRSGLHQISFGIALGVLWVSALFGVLETESLLGKTLMLVILAPLSIALDKLVTLLLSGTRNNPQYSPKTQLAVISALTSAEAHDPRMVA